MTKYNVCWYKEWLFCVFKGVPLDFPPNIITYIMGGVLVLLITRK